MCNFSKLSKILIVSIVLSKTIPYNINMISHLCISTTRIEQPRVSEAVEIPTN